MDAFLAGSSKRAAGRDLTRLASVAPTVRAGYEETAEVITALANLDIADDAVTRNASKVVSPSCSSFGGLGTSPIPRPDRG